jgi:predicted nucleic acid-binding protein
MLKKWVLNASPLIILAKIDQLILLRHLCEEMVVPGGVAGEIARGPEDDPARQWLQFAGKGLIREVGPIPPVILAWNLGQGESEVITWAYKNPDYEAILDDRAARKQQPLKFRCEARSGSSSWQNGGADWQR